MVLVAAGNGERLGRGIPKALVEVSGKTILEHALGNVLTFFPDELVVVAHEDHVEEFRSIVESAYPGKFQIAPGGSSRQGSVENGIALVSTDRVLVHDAARCFAPAELFALVEGSLDTADCVVPTLAVADTIKQISGSEVVATIDRTLLRAAQTPQGFHTTKLREAMASSQEQFTDEAALVQSLGQSVVWVEGSAKANKITTNDDLARVENQFATGIGTDAHRFSEGGVLVLGCLQWPDFPKLEGHSDGDSIAHAIVDSMLSAAGLGDIGSNFGVDRPEYQGASGEVFLAATLNMIRQSSFELVNVAVQVVADRPKIGPRRSELEARLTELLGAKVSVGATTTDGLGFLADSRGVAAVATALLQRRS